MVVNSNYNYNHRYKKHLHCNQRTYLHTLSLQPQNRNIFSIILYFIKYRISLNAGEETFQHLKKPRLILTNKPAKFTKTFIPYEPQSMDYYR